MQMHPYYSVALSAAIVGGLVGVASVVLVVPLLMTAVFVGGWHLATDIGIIRREPAAPA